MPKIKPDTGGIDALTGKAPDMVPELPLLIWEGIVADLGPVPEAPHIDPFDETPWQQLPTLEDLEKLWLMSPLVDIMIQKLAITAHGDGPDLMRYMAGQRELAEIELRLKKEREATDGPAHADDHRKIGKNGTVRAAGTRGGRGDVPGEPENGDKVGKSRKAHRDPDTWGSQKIQGRRGTGKAS